MHTTSLALLVLSCSLLWLPGQASRESKGWISLFDGKTLDHWNDPRKLNPPGDGWTVEEGAIKALPKPRITEELVSTEGYADYELEWQWKISEGGNAGVKYRVQALPVLTEANRPKEAKKFEPHVDQALRDHDFDRTAIPPDTKAQIYVVGFEYQMIDNARHPDAKRGPLYQSAALYGIAPANKDASKPVGEWNQSRLVVRGEHFEHWLNDAKVVDVVATPELLTNALEKRWGAGSEALRLLVEQPKKQCPITLQNHGDLAWYRNIRIRTL